MANIKATVFMNMFIREYENVKDVNNNKDGTYTLFMEEESKPRGIIRVSEITVPTNCLILEISEERKIEDHN